MRDLTIKRRKVSVGSLAKAKIYIEDSLAPELTIDKTPCRKLGELKNGEEQTFRIGDQAARIYVISDKLSKEYCNEYYQLPEGQEDVVLTGQNQFSFGMNAFRFDDNNSAGIEAKRKKGTAIGIIVFVAAIVIGLVAGRLVSSGLLKSRAAAPKEFTSHGMTITLTKDFKEDSAMGFTTCFSSKDVFIAAQRDTFTLLDGLEDYSLQDYGKLVLENNDMSGSLLKSFNGIPGFEYDYTDPDDGNTYHYRIFLYKADDAFWMVQFFTYKDDFSKLESQINQWAKSVTFGK